MTLAGDMSQRRSSTSPSSTTKQPAREMVGDYLRMHGFSVTPVRRRRQPARRPSPQQMPDLIVLDLNMPEEDGLSIIRDLKQRTSVPIIMLTATASAIDRVVGLELGADDYLAKPCELRELLARIRVVLRRSAGRSRRRPPQPPPAAPRPTSWCGSAPNGSTIDAQALRDDDGNEHPLTASEYGLLKVFAANPEARPVARAAAGTGQCARRRGLRPGDRPAHHADPAQNRARPGPSVGHPHRPGRRLCFSPGGETP